MSNDGRRTLLSNLGDEAEVKRRTASETVGQQNPRSTGHAQKFSVRRFWNARGKLFKTVILLVGLFILVGFTDFNAFISRPLIEQQPVAAADALVILGGGISAKTGQLGFKTEERVRSGAALYAQGIAPVVVVTGGKVGDNPFAEAPAMAELLTRLGVVENQIFQDDLAQNTLENAANVVAMAKTQGWGKLIVLTSDFHTSRACTFFRRAGADVICRAADREAVEQHTVSRRLQGTKVVLREYAANVYYWLKGER
ncbi:MAG: YdcF family protein [Patescibacteria group bacterium]